MFYYLRKCKSEVLAYVLVALVYALILAATGLGFQRRLCPVTKRHL
ncbi:TPA: hypothetical protein U2B97_001053 [Streptococcus suis]|nr:hypothetical protein [Streptococcus suis]